MESKDLEMRKCEVCEFRGSPSSSLVKGVWIEKPFSELKEGQVYRLFDLEEDLDGSPQDEKGASIHLALTDAKPTKPDGNWVVESIELVNWRQDEAEKTLEAVYKPTR